MLFAAPCSLELISHGTIFFSHSKLASVDLSAAETKLNSFKAVLNDTECFYDEYGE